MIANLSDYFLPEHEYYLKNISYNRIDNPPKLTDHMLSCTDNLSASIQGNRVRIILERGIKFDPHEFFELSISFGAELTFNEEKSAQIDWSTINLAEEFHQNGEFVLSNLVSRISLLIAQITSSFGQPPLILPTVVAK